ncbi:hypothetical protein N7512_001063 [Penicillium capsulatum]|nr:hypothetical protein N7512_001063 [Penicillium capsulatum]
MISKAVMDLPIILLASEYSKYHSCQSITVVSKALGPEYIETSCRKLHSTGSSIALADPGPLSWLRTNRQIYTEAQTVVYESLSLHFCDPRLLETMQLQRTPTQKLQYETFRSLSFCLQVELVHDKSEGYRFATNVEYGVRWWSRIIKDDHGYCGCYWCIPPNGTEMDELFPELKEVRFHVYFLCRPHYDDPQPTVDQGSSGDHENMRKLVNDLLDERPLGMFKGGRPKSGGDRLRAAGYRAQPGQAAAISGPVTRDDPYPTEILSARVDLPFVPVTESRQTSDRHARIQSDGAAHAIDMEWSGLYNSGGRCMDPTEPWDKKRPVAACIRAPEPIWDYGTRDQHRFRSLHDQKSQRPERDPVESRPGLNAGIDLGQQQCPDICQWP